MTLQQLEYIVALNRHRHFVKAAIKCGVSQPTLSAMISKLESELDVQIFDREKHPVEPTAIGLRIIHQAETCVNNADIIKEIVSSEMHTLVGPLKIAFIPTVAPYLVPGLITEFNQNYPDVELSISEMITNNIISHLLNADFDMAILSTPLENPDLYEIPLYYERFVAYFSPDYPDRDIPLKAKEMPMKNLWMLQEGHCFRKQIFNFCNSKEIKGNCYEAGSIETLIRIVDKLGGYTVIPELHISFLTEKQKENIREIKSPPAIRQISLVIRKDYVREKMLNAVADAIKKFIPESMIDSRLKKFAIRLI